MDNLGSGTNIVISKLADCIFASLAWLIFCLPIFTIGASSAALYNTVHCVIRHDREIVWDCFWASFKKSFKRATVCWLAILALAAFFGLDLMITYQAVQRHDPLGRMFPLCCLPIAYLIMWCFYIFAFIGRFPNEKKHILKNTAIMAVAHLHWSILMLLAVVAAIIVLLVIPVSVFFSPAIVGIICNWAIEKVFEKIMTEEEQKAEEEENQRAKLS